MLLLRSPAGARQRAEGEGAALPGLGLDHQTPAQHSDEGHPHLGTCQSGDQ